MGYGIQITRKQFWCDDRGPEITLREWAAYIERDPEMRLDGFIELPLPSGELLRIEDPSIAVWAAHPEFPDSASLRLSTLGNVTVTNPDHVFVQKMWRIAHSLRARVIGDEHETYGADGRPDGGHAFPPDDWTCDVRPLDAPASRRKPLWQRVFRR